MNRQEHSDTYARENESRIAHREFLLQGVEKLTLFHDTFMKVVLNNLDGRVIHQDADDILADLEVV